MRHSSERGKQVRKIITADEAISLLPDNDNIHTFYNLPIGLVGADWSKEDIIDKLKKVDTIELTGETARRMNHGLAAYNKNAKQSDVLFIETDKEKIDRFDPLTTEVQDE